MIEELTKHVFTGRNGPTNGETSGMTLRSLILSVVGFMFCLLSKSGDCWWMDVGSALLMAGLVEQLRQAALEAAFTAFRTRGGAGFIDELAAHQCNPNRTGCPSGEAIRTYTSGNPLSIILYSPLTRSVADAYPRGLTLHAQLNCATEEGLREGFLETFGRQLYLALWTLFLHQPPRFEEEVFYRGTDQELPIGEFYTSTFMSTSRDPDTASGFGKWVYKLRLSPHVVRASIAHYSDRDEQEVLIAANQKITSSLYEAGGQATISASVPPHPLFPFSDYRASVSRLILSVTTG